MNNRLKQLIIAVSLVVFAALTVLAVVSVVIDASERNGHPALSTTRVHTHAVVPASIVHDASSDVSAAMGHVPAVRVAPPNYVVVTKWPSKHGCLSCIAADVGVALARIEALNPMPNFNLVYPGQHILIAGTVPARPAAPRPIVPAASARRPLAPPAAPPAARPPTPRPTAPPVASGTVTGMIISVFGGYANAALAVARCESGYNPNAYNASSGASGVFQFLYSTWLGTPYAGYSRFNAWANIHAAYWLFARDGYTWREWVCQP